MWVIFDVKFSHLTRYAVKIEFAFILDCAVYSHSALCANNCPQLSNKCPLVVVNPFAWNHHNHLHCHWWNFSNCLDCEYKMTKPGVQNCPTNQPKKIKSVLKNSKIFK